MISKDITIGSGAYFPISLTEINGKSSWKALSGDVRLINHNLISLFNTQIGYLLRNEDFGTRLWECLEEPNTQALRFLIHRFCKDAIESWEPRITPLDTSIETTSSSIKITLRYQIKGDSVMNLYFSYDKQTNTFSL